MSGDTYRDLPVYVLFNKKTNSCTTIDKTEEAKPTLMPKDCKILEIVLTTKTWTDAAAFNEINKYFDTSSFMEHLIATYGVTLPKCFVILINGKEVPLHPLFIDNVTLDEVDWKYYSGIMPITLKSIDDEKNMTKRRTLMKRYGMRKFKNKMKLISEDHNGTLWKYTWNIDGRKIDTHYFECIDGTAHEHLKGREDCTEDGRHIYFVEVDITKPLPTLAKLSSFRWPDEWKDVPWTQER